MKITGWGAENEIGENGGGAAPEEDSRATEFYKTWLKGGLQVA